MAVSITRLNASTLKIFVDGKLNALTASKFRREMEKISAGTRIILDFRNLFYISSAGLREIFICRKKYPDMRIENVSRDVNLIFLMTGFEEFIPITLAEDDALKNAVANESNISFKKFLRDKAAFFGDEVAIVTA
ncbi:MAG: STAS domain-containing protein, partial [Selenomonadaceae bacterium]|nr:STAS domain-containing protein [Selenomonadaceae bacterium]